MFWRGVWGYLPANIVTGLTGFLGLVIFTRLLQADDYGRYALAFSVMTLSHVAVFTWLEAAMARFWAAESGQALKDHFHSLYRATLTLAAVFIPVAAGVILALPVDAPLKIAIAAGVLGAPLRCLNKLAQERFRASGEVARAAAVDIVTAVAGLAIGVGFALAGAGGAAPLLGLTLAPLLTLPFVLPTEWRRGLGGRYLRDRLRAYASYGYPIAAALALSLVLASTDRFLLAAFLDEAAVGAYHAAYSLSNRTLDVMFIWLGSAGAPALVMALERSGRKGLEVAAREQASTFLLLALPSAAGLALVARPLAEIMIGDELRVATASVTPLIALSALMAGLTTYYFGQAFTLARNTRRLFAAMAIPAVSNIVLNLLLIPLFGLIGAALATVLSYALGLAATLVLGRRVLALPIPWRALLSCGLATGVMTVAVLTLPSPGGWAELILKAGVGAGVYALAALAFDAGGVRRLARSRLSRAVEQPA
ncbi:MAG: lipopolysaccharide biosynthesis protein [Brevundimonas sp.]